MRANYLYQIVDRKGVAPDRVDDDALALFSDVDRLIDFDLRLIQDCRRAAWRCFPTSSRTFPLELAYKQCQYAIVLARPHRINDIVVRYRNGSAPRPVDYKMRPSCKHHVAAVVPLFDCANRNSDPIPLIIPYLPMGARF